MNLLETMRRRRVNAMIADAQFLRDQENSAGKKEAIEHEIRRVMFRFTTNQILLSERDAIFEILRG